MTKRKPYNGASSSRFDAFLELSCRLEKTLSFRAAQSGAPAIFVACPTLPLAMSVLLEKHGALLPAEERERIEAWAAQLDGAVIVVSFTGASVDLSLLCVEDLYEGLEELAGGRAPVSTQPTNVRVAALGLLAVPVTPCSDAADLTDDPAASDAIAVPRPHLGGAW